MSYSLRLRKAFIDHMKTHKPRNTGYGIKQLPGKDRDLLVVVLYKKNFDEMSPSDQERYKESAHSLIRKLSLLTFDQVIWDWADEYAPEKGFNHE